MGDVIGALSGELAIELGRFTTEELQAIPQWRVHSSHRRCLRARLRVLPAATTMARK